MKYLSILAGIIVSGMIVLGIGLDNKISEDIQDAFIVASVCPGISTVKATVSTWNNSVETTCIGAKGGKRGTTNDYFANGK